MDTKHIKHLYPIALEVAKRITVYCKGSVWFFKFYKHRHDRISINRPAPVFITFNSRRKTNSGLDSTEARRRSKSLLENDRDVAERLGYYKPAQIHSKFLPGLGVSGKMSSSKPETALFTTDDPEIVEKKVSSAFTGGQATVALQRKLGR